MSTMFQRWIKSTTPMKEGWGPCYRKGAYRTKEIAEHYRDKSQSTNPKLKLYIYECKVCKHFHLTKQKQATNE